MDVHDFPAIDTSNMRRVGFTGLPTHTAVASWGV